MKTKILIVEDQFIEANDLRLILVKAGYEVCAIARSVPKAQEIIIKEKPDLVLLDIFLKGKLTGIDLARELKEQHVAFIYLSANSSEEILAAAKATQPYGFLVKPFREKDVLVTLEVAQYLHLNSLEANFRKEALWQKKIAELTTSSLSPTDKLQEIAKSLQPFIPFEYLSVKLKNQREVNHHDLAILRTEFDEYRMMGTKELMILSNLKLHELAPLLELNQEDETAACYNFNAFKKLCEQPSMKKIIASKLEMQSLLTFPLAFDHGNECYLSFYSKTPGAFSSDHLVILNRLQLALVHSIESIFHAQKNSISKLLAGRKDLMNTPSAEVLLFESIIGNSHLLHHVFDLVMQVAPVDTSVLILGESGTGKEKIAKIIHQLSPRKTKPLVIVNCATLPPNLIESELFGHERGAFTGAVEKRIGKFEQASGGTIFLDEIGEMPLELQVKLLRVLQEKEIERIGSKSPTKVNVRIIAATHKNLEKEVAESRFRLDLYYRLNVFPIQLPALRERKEDIPLLCSYFIRQYNQKTGKKITRIHEKTLKSLLQYQWPGNIRELEHLIERSVLLARGTVIDNIPLPAINYTEQQEVTGWPQVKTLHENERDYILNILKKCNGKIWGPDGAAELMNLPPTTLCSKMKKLGIKKEYKV